MYIDGPFAGEDVETPSCAKPSSIVHIFYRGFLQSNMGQFNVLAGYPRWENSPPAMSIVYQRI